MTTVKANELFFQINEDEEGIIHVLFETKDPSHELADNLRHHNIEDLPDVFGQEDAENYFMLHNRNLEEVREALFDAGFEEDPNDFNPAP